MTNKSIFWGLLCAMMCSIGLSWIGLRHYPNYFPKPHYEGRMTDMSVPEIDLGRHLFYDPRLSRDNSISCASCHSPFNAFAHSDHDLSHGIDDQIGTRNAPGLFNLGWQTVFMWDGAINHLDMQALAPMTHPKEMDESLTNVLQKLSTDAFYRKKFENVYGPDGLTGPNFLRALTAFELSLISTDAYYDKVTQNRAQFTKQQVRGQALFTKHCQSCHTAPLFSNYEFVRHTLKIDSTLDDLGRFMVTLRSQDSARFKVPSLRNLSFTAPYMHDGRFHSLREVLNHYAQTDTARPDVDPRLKKAVVADAVDKTDLIAFLLTLNDTTFVFNPDHRLPYPY